MTNSDFVIKHDQFIEMRAEALKRKHQLVSEDKTFGISMSKSDQEMFFTLSGAGIALAVIETVASLYKMKTEADAADRLAHAVEEIYINIDALDQRLVSIKGQLDEIQKELKEMSVKIDEVPLKVALSNLYGIVDTIIDSIDTWATNPTESVNQQSMVLARNDLAQIIRSLMRLGYAHCVSVLMAFVFELDLDLLLGYKYKQIKPSINRILKYIDDCLNLGEQNSIQHRLQEFETRILTMEKEDEQMTRIASLGKKSIGICRSNRDYYRTTEYFCEIIGNITDGYEIKTYSKIIREGQCYADALPPEVELFAELVPCPFSMTELNKKTTVYHDLVKTKEFLTEVIKKLRNVETQIETRALWHQNVFG